MARRIKNIDRQRKARRDAKLARRRTNSLERRSEIRRKGETIKATKRDLAKLPKHIVMQEEKRRQTPLDEEKPTVWKIKYTHRRKRLKSNLESTIRSLDSWAKNNQDKVNYRIIDKLNLSFYSDQMKPGDVILLPLEHQNLKASKGKYKRLIDKIPNLCIVPNKEPIIERLNESGLGTKRGFTEFCIKHELSYPKTWMGEEWIELEKKPNADGFIVKINKSSLGRGVFLVENIATVENILLREGAENCIVQERIKTGEKVFDMRIWMVRETYVGAITRNVQENSSDFRANLTLGGYAEEYIPTEDELELCRETMRLSNMDYSAIDLIKDENGKTYLMEANITAGMNRTKRILKALPDDFAQAYFENLEEILNMRKASENSQAAIKLKKASKTKIRKHEPSWRK